MSTKLQSDYEMLPSIKKKTLKGSLNSFKLLSADAGKTIKQAKKISWQNYVNNLNSSIKEKYSIENDHQIYWKKRVYSTLTPH